MKHGSDGKVLALTKVPLFAGCGHHELVGLARLFDASSAHEGDRLEVEGRRSKWWTIIVTGCATASHRGRPTGLLSAGEFWGERSILNREPSRVSIVALTPMSLLTLDRRCLLELPRHHPGVASRLIRELGSRRAPYECSDEEGLVASAEGVAIG